MYQQQLNVLVRWAESEFPDRFSEAFTRSGHDISNILQQIKDESSRQTQDQDESAGQTVGDGQAPQDRVGWKPLLWLNKKKLPIRRK